MSPSNKGLFLRTELILIFVPCFKVETMIKGLKILEIKSQIMKGINIEKLA